MKTNAKQGAAANSFAIVTDIVQIAQLNSELGRRLSTSFNVKRSREITYPAGHHTGTVYFESAAGSAVRAWSRIGRPDKLINFLLTGDPDAPTWLQIDVQLNFPAGTYTGVWPARSSRTRTAALWSPIEAS